MIGMTARPKSTKGAGSLRVLSLEADLLENICIAAAAATGVNGGMDTLDAACDLLRRRGLPDPYGDLLRHNGRLERIVPGIAQHELKRMRPGRKLEQRFGLSCPEMQMRLVLQDRLLGIDRVFDVDEQMM